ncbi:MAG: hypothetical protein K6E61_04030 [Bacteroidales bacterium]|nr:hypothetical protein [Bacteroidales bacterium]
MRSTIRYLIPAVLVALAGCNPENLPWTASANSAGQEVVTISFNVEPFDTQDTKGIAADIVDDEVDRIDIFAFESNGDVHGHTVIGEYGGDPLNLDEITFREYGISGTVRCYLIMANLDPDSADYIASLDKNGICTYPKAFIPWSAGNCRPGRPLMGTTARITFSSNESGTVELNLMRYMSKFRIGTITAQFWGTPDLYRNVYVKHVAFINGWDIVRICQTRPQDFQNADWDIFGPKGWSSNAFGGAEYNYYMANCFLAQDEWSTYNMTYADMHGTYNLGEYGGKGKLNQSYNYLYNDNHMQPKHSINLTAPTPLIDVSQQTWDTNAYLPTLAGKLCDEYDGDLGPLQVNKVFYTLPTKFNAWFTEPTYGDESQNNELRLCLAVKINGTLYFYSKMITGLNPNMYYIIHNITLAGEPSEYPNTWVRGGQVTKAGVSEEQWHVHGNVAEIDNLVL